MLIASLQVLSITETQYRDSSIIIISPDSDNLSVIQAALVGADLRNHNQFAFKPGEVCLQLLGLTVLAAGAAAQPSAACRQGLELHLARLRSFHVKGTMQSRAGVEANAVGSWMSRLYMAKP